MPEYETDDFIRTSFRSVWTLELLLFLRKNGSRSWTPEDLVASLRASDLIVSQGIEQLFAGGLIVVEDDGSARYAPSSQALDEQVGTVEQLYAKRPGVVRRLITMTANSSLTAFADAFRLRRN